MNSKLIHPSFKPVTPITPQQAFEKVFMDIQQLGKLVNGLTDGLAELYERFHALEQHLGLTVVQEQLSKPASIEIVPK